MPLKASIASKIFGLAGVLLALTIFVATFLLYEVTLLTRELAFVSDYEIPLARSISQVNEYGLRRRLAFERWYGALNSPSPDQEVLKDAKGNYSTFTELLHDQLAIATRLMDEALRGDNHLGELHSLKTMLEQIDAAYPTISTRQRELIALQESQERERARGMIDFLNDYQGQVQKQRSELEEGISELVQASASNSAERQGQIFWLTIVVTAVSVALGVVLSTIITRGLVRPVHSLMAGMQSVENGDLSVELPVKTSDEVGALTKSFNYFVTELRSKEQLKRTFGRYIDPRVLERVILQPGTTDASGGRRVMSVLFSDIAGMTPIGEQVTATSLVNLLNNYFTLQSEAVQIHLGIVDKFIGDSVMAFWGPPFTDEATHAKLACRSALAQLRALDLFRTKVPELTGLRKNIPLFDMRIGIGTGDVVVGNIGSENARSYTVIGDTVNFASRLEGINRFYGTRILVSQNTQKNAGPEFLTREIDLLVVKGKSEPERVFELLGVVSEVEPALESICEPFQAALTAYRTQSWDEAEAKFKMCLTIRPSDPPSVTFLERIAHFRKESPGADWDGIWKFSVK